MGENAYGRPGEETGDTLVARSKGETACELALSRAVDVKLKFGKFVYTRACSFNFNYVEPGGAYDSLKQHSMQAAEAVLKKNIQALDRLFFSCEEHLAFHF